MVSSTKMSKLSFRARALDASKPMPIFMAEDLPDLPDFSAINRSVPQMPSGMQKEEECEHHLQRAICAGLIIPTPEVTDVPLRDFYDRVCPSNYKQPRQLIHMQPLTMEQDIPDYDLDSDDEKWLEALQPRLELTPLKFEEMMDRLEKSSGQTVVSLSEAKALLKEDDDLTIAVFDYWLNKRLKTQHPLILTVRTEQRSGIAANNPYLAFRRRTEKMQTRKNRKNDEVSYEKMLKLRRDLVRASTLLELIKKREKLKREFVHLGIEVFEKRYQARDFNGALVAEANAVTSKTIAVNQRPAFTPIFHNHYPNQSWSDSGSIGGVGVGVGGAVGGSGSGGSSSVSGSVQSAVQVAKNNILKDEVVPRREKRQYKKRKHKSINNRAGGGGSGTSSTLNDILLSSDEESPLTQRGLHSRSSTPLDTHHEHHRHHHHHHHHSSSHSHSRHSPDEQKPQEDDGPFVFRRNRLCSYHMPLPQLGNWPWCSSEENGTADKRYRFCLTSLSKPKRCIGYARRRVGRGGRIILDRFSTGSDDFWKGMDFSIIEPKKDGPTFNKQPTSPPPLQPLDDSAVSIQSASVKLNNSLIRTTSGTINDRINSTFNNSKLNQTEHSLSSMANRVLHPHTMIITSTSNNNNNLISNKLNCDSVVSDDKLTPQNNNNKQDTSNVQMVNKKLSELVNRRMEKSVNMVTSSTTNNNDRKNVMENNQDNTTSTTNNNNNNNNVIIGNDEEDFFKSIRDSWLHFRPKTPPSDYEPPCYLLPPDSPIFATTNPSIPSFQMEVQSNDDNDEPSSALLFSNNQDVDDSRAFTSSSSPAFLTDLFELDRRWTTTIDTDPTSASTSGNADVGSDEYLTFDPTIHFDYKTVGVSTFTLSDLSGEILPRIHGGVKDEDNENSCDNNKEVVIVDKEDDQKKSKQQPQKQQNSNISFSNVIPPLQPPPPPPNGLMQIGFATDVFTSSKTQHNNIFPTYLYNSHNNNNAAASNNSATTTSTGTSINLLTAASAPAIQTVTLNNHNNNSANNIIEFPLTTATVDVQLDEGMELETTSSAAASSSNIIDNVGGNDKGGGAGNPSGSNNTASTTNGAVRNNNNKNILAMEVT